MNIFLFHFKNAVTQLQDRCYGRILCEGLSAVSFMKTYLPDVTINEPPSSLSGTWNLQLATFSLRENLY